MGKFYLVLFFFFLNEEQSYCFLQQLYHFIVPITARKDSNFPTSLPTAVIFFLHSSHPNGCEVNRLLSLIRCLEYLMQSKCYICICPALDCWFRRRSLSTVPLHFLSRALSRVRVEQHIRVFSLSFTALPHVIQIHIGPFSSPG